jgi:hypothetical protein
VCWRGAIIGQLCLRSCHKPGPHISGNFAHPTVVTLSCWMCQEWGQTLAWPRACVKSTG